MTFKKRLNILNSPFMVLACVGLVSCASGVKKVDLPAGSDPQAELSKAEAHLQESQDKQYDQLSPKHFSSAQDAIAKARKDIEEGNKTETILDNLGLALGHLRVVDKNGDKYKARLDPVISARQAAVDAKALDVMKSDMNDADEDFAKIGRDIEKEDFEMSAERVSDLQKRYGDIELDAIKTSNLGAVRSLIEKAEGNDAEDNAPKTFENAKAQYASATRSIEANRRAPEVYRADVAKSVEAAKKLNRVLEITKQKHTSESAALTIYAQEVKLAAQKTQIAGSRNTVGALKAEVSANQEALQGVRAENQQYANKEQLNQRISAIEDEFAPEEAEVLRDGNNIIVRLKTMKFSTARAEINSASLMTLQKVKKLIEAVPVEKIMVEGHTDSVGTAEVNQALSEKRAASVKDYFVSEQVADPSKITAEGYGFEKPLTSNKSKEGRATNRRVDIVIQPSVAL